MSIEETLTGLALPGKDGVVDIVAERVTEFDEGVSGREEDGGVLFHRDKIFEFGNGGLGFHIAKGAGSGSAHVGFLVGESLLRKVQRLGIVVEKTEDADGCGATVGGFVGKAALKNGPGIVERRLRLRDGEDCEKEEE
jgi:hypothetical protein